MGKVLILGGPLHGREVLLRREPSRIEVAGRIYTQVVDPDNGDFLGAYALAETKETSA